MAKKEQQFDQIISFLSWRSKTWVKKGNYI